MMIIDGKTTAKRKTYCSVCMVLLATLVLGFANSYADQAIYVDMLDFIPEESEYILDDKERELKLKEVQRDFLGHVWRIVGDKDALGDKAMDAPGDNDFNSFIELTFEL